MNGDVPLRRLVLHFTAKHVLLVNDIGAGVSAETTLNDLLARSAWGTLDVATGNWVLVSEEPSAFPPSEGLLSYFEHVNRKFQTEGEELDDETRSFNLASVSKAIASFTAKDQPGHKFRPFFDQMVKCLSLPKGVSKAMGIERVVLADDDIAPLEDERSSMLRLGRYQVMPAFWNLVMHLAKEKRDFQIVFRGTQAEIDKVAQEWNFFCDGSHPCYCGANKTKKAVLDGSKGTKDMRLGAAALGRWSIDDPSAGGVGHVVSFPDLNENEADLAEYNAKVEAQEEAQRKAEADGVEAPPPLGDPPRTVAAVFRGQKQVYNGIVHFVLTNARQSAAVVEGVQEAEPDIQKRVLLVNEADLAIHNVLFIHDKDADTAEVLEVCTGDELEPSSARHSLVYPVELFKMITNPEYLIKAVVEAEEMRSRQLEAAREKEAADAKANDPLKPLSSEQLKACPPKEYLYHTVIPALMPALEIVQRDRPADPITALAMYLLRHGDQYSKALHEPVEAPPPVDPGK